MSQDSDLHLLVTLWMNAYAALCPIQQSTILVELENRVLLVVRAKGEKMSEENVRTIIAKAVADMEYRDLLFDDPGKALEGYDLTDEEQAELKGLEREKFDTAAGELEERISRFTPQPEPPGNLLNLASFLKLPGLHT